MGFLKLLEAGRFGIKMRAEKAKDAAGSGIAHVIDLAVWHVVLVDVGPDILLQPEGHGRRNGPLGLEGIAAIFEPMLGAQLGFLRHGGDDGDTPGFSGVFLHGLFLHFVAAARTDLEGSAQHILPLLGQMKAAGAAVAPDAVNLLQHFGRVAALDALDPLGLFFANDGIATLLDDLAETDLRPEPRHIGRGSHELADLRKFEASIRKNGRHIRVHLPDDMQKDGGVLAARERDVDIAVPVLIPLADALTGHIDFGLQWEALLLL